MERKNKHVILVAGYRRGGTNILWNLIQSHPNICTPINETGQIFNRNWKLRLIKTFPYLFKGEKSNSLIDNELFKCKLQTLLHEENKYKRPDKLYTKEEVENSWLCLKSVDEDIYMTSRILDVYPDLILIVLTRNGYALAESFKRRGKSLNQSANLYSDIAKSFYNFAEKAENSLFIKFEDVLKDPFLMANKLFTFLKITPANLELLRFKSKKVVDKKGEHHVTFGDENKKYWFNKENIGDFMDPDVNKKQLSRLSRDEIEKFNGIAGETLKSFGYKPIEV